jgi:PAS domain S-box-containing protein
VAAARGLVRDLLAEAGRDDLAENAMLLVSEVVTNALLHAGTPIDVCLRFDERGLRVEVGDGSPHLPARRHYAATAGTGRGLMMLEQMVDDWGVTRHGSGKTVWFELGHADDHVGDGAVAGRTSGEARTTAEALAIELRNMPLLLHAAWQEHAEALLREYLLVSLDGASGRDPIQVHAEATDAIAVLEEHVPRAEVAMDPDRLMADATEPRVSAAALRVPVPRRSLPNFATLDETIEAALELAENGQVMTPPTQPEIRAFRRWLCGEVRGQAGGAAPSAWSVSDESDARPVAGPGRTVTAAEHTQGARVVADETSRILAVSPDALALLGYDDPADLVGRRIVAIIPERYRQAHVAGFTMYLLVGRRPLIGTPVTVPVRLRDGTELPVRMIVTVEPTGEGAQVFVADLEPAG